jgi:4-amino-4-deoxy-L-arabinose transferase-like glycosyltransferase
MKRLNFAFERGRNWIFLLASYFLANIVLRVLVSTTVGFDESEIVIAAQEFAWGYGPQPPLYVWLQSVLFSVIGVNVLALGILKNVVLFSIYVFTYFSAKEVLKNQNLAVLASASLFLIPTVLWESLRSQTHTVLATAMASATLLIVLRILRSPTRSNYLLLGFSGGLGILSKYNFVVFLTALVIGALSLHASRRRILQPKILISLSVAFLLTAPHGLWLLDHLGYLSTVAGKLASESDPSYLQAVATGSLKLTLALLSFTTLLVLSYCSLFRDYIDVKTTCGCRLLNRVFVAAASICFIVVLVFAAASFKDRWLDPILFFVPICAVCFLRRDIPLKNIRRALIFGGALALVSLTILHGRILMAPSLGKLFPLNIPFEVLAVQIQNKVIQPEIVAAQDQVIGGNLRLNFENSFVLTPNFITPRKTPARPSSVLVIWNASQTRSIPLSLKKLLGQWPNLEHQEATPDYVRASTEGFPNESVELGFVLITDP